MKTYILIDRSGSMMGSWVEMMGSLKTFMSKLEKGKVHVACFDSSGSLNYDVIHNGKRKEWHDEKVLNFSPRGGTPLYDAVGHLNQIILNDRQEKAQIVIITDGFENASQEYSQIGVKNILKGWEEREFDVIYMGASFDGAYASAASIGISAGKTINMTSSATFSATMDSVATRGAGYASGTLSGDDELSGDTRKAAGETE